MGFFKRLIDILTLKSEHPVRRLIAYYLILAALVVALAYLFPIVDRVLGGAEPTQLVRVPQILQDGLQAAPDAAPEQELPPRLELAITTLIIMIATLALALPVSWVYMSARAVGRHNQQIAQTLIFLPVVVAGVVIVVQNSLALAFSLAGVVAAVRFRTTLRDTRDVVFIFLVIALGFAAGVQSLVVGAVFSLVFNFIMILTWRYDFGRNVLEPTATSQWSEPLRQLAHDAGNGSIPDRDLVLAIDPERAKALAERFDRVHRILGEDAKKPRVNAILSISTNDLQEVQTRLAPVLDEIAGRWQIDEVVTHTDKPSQLYYLVRLKKKTSRDDLLTAVQAAAGEFIKSAELEVADARLEKEEKEQYKAS
jgi:hypothetical protein